MASHCWGARYSTSTSERPSISLNMVISVVPTVSNSKGIGPGMGR